MANPHHVVNGQVEILSGNRWRKGEYTDCLWCGKRFVRLATSLNPEKLKKFCSAKCMMAERKAHRAKERRVYKECVICGAAFKVYRSKFDRYKTCGNNRCKFLMASQAMTEKHRKRREKSA